jgi:phage terminase large subunit-like protein
VPQKRRCLGPSEPRPRTPTNRSGSSCLTQTPPPGAGPIRTLVTTTPKPLPFLNRLIAQSAVTRGRMADNLHLPPDHVARMEAAYRGGRKGREELDGELIEDVEGALWTRALIERSRDEAGRLDPGAGAAAEAGSRFARIIVGVDPPASAGGDACGIVACAVDGHEIGHVLEDASVRGLSPEGWAGAVVAAAARWGADCVVVEKNQGGDMVRSVLRAADPALPVRPVHARYGKCDRAEPVALLFEQGRVRLRGSFPALEDELCAMIRGGGYQGRGRSPDRADAMIWALTELMLGREAGAPRVLGL